MSNNENPLSAAKPEEPSIPAAPEPKEGKPTQAELSQEMLAIVNKPPRTDKKELEERRQLMASLLAERYPSIRTVLGGNEGQQVTLIRREVKDAIKAQVKSANPDISPETLAKPLNELIPLLKKFDWRSLRITPFVRDQGDCGSCWAHAATEAFESSLMLQRANLEPSLVLSDEQKFPLRAKISLSVESVLDSVDNKGARCAAGRHERAFDHFFENGVPLAGLSTSKSSNISRDVKLSPEENAKDLIKAIAWDYVHLPPHEIPSELEMKAALLEHGPLVVMLTIDDEFQAYGKLKEGEEVQPVPVADDDFPVDNAPVFHSMTHQDFPNHYVLLIGWDDAKHAWIVQNSYGTNWGYQCDGPRVMNDILNIEPHSADRGFMYICRNNNSNDLGAYASWVEAPLLFDPQIREVEKITATRAQRQG